MSNRINTYTCPKGHIMVTKDVDEGVTPMLLNCKHKKDVGRGECGQTAMSAGYQCDQTLTPEYEWFKPRSLSGYSEGMKEHIRKGGLEIRKIKTIKDAI